jgi:prepilin-type N-terminal cleavage/methylation domain-containing protein
VSARDRGFTVVEVVIAASVLVIVVVVALGTLGTMSEHVAKSTVQLDLRARAHDAAMLMQRELRAVSRTSLALDDADPVSGKFRRVRYRSVAGFDTADKKVLLDPAAGDPHDVRFELEATETSNGVDDDGDGLIDEGRLVLYRGGAEVAELTRSVRASSLELSLQPGNGASYSNGDTHLYVSFTLQQRSRTAGEPPEEHTEMFHVGIRN